MVVLHEQTKKLMVSSAEVVENQVSLGAGVGIFAFASPIHNPFLNGPSGEVVGAVATRSQIA